MPTRRCVPLRADNHKGQCPELAYYETGRWWGGTCCLPQNFACRRRSGYTCVAGELSVVEVDWASAYGGLDQCCHDYRGTTCPPCFEILANTAGECPKQAVYQMTGHVFGGMCCMPPGWLCSVKRDAPCADKEVQVRGVIGEAEEHCCRFDSHETAAMHDQCVA